jgi:hypothetical protein
VDPQFVGTSEDLAAAGFHTWRLLSLLLFLLLWRLFAADAAAGCANGVIGSATAGATATPADKHCSRRRGGRAGN